MKKLSSFVASVAVASALIVAPTASAEELVIGPEFSAEDRALIQENAQRLEREAKERAAQQAAGEVNLDAHGAYPTVKLLNSNISSVKLMWECWKDYPDNYRNPFFQGEKQNIPKLDNAQYHRVHCPLTPVTDKDREAARKKIADGSAVQSSPGLVASFVSFFWKIIETIRAFFEKNK